MIVGRVAAALAALMLATVLVGLPTAARAEWRKAESAHFIIYSDQKESVLREYVTTMEDFDNLLRAMHGRPAGETIARKLDIYVVGSRRQLKRTWPTAPDNVGGYYSYTSSDLFAVAVSDSAQRARDPTAGDDTLFHEYVHHFMKQNYSFGYPAWLTEGYAEYYATSDMGAKEVTIGRVSAGRANTLTTDGGWIDMESVLTKRVFQLKTQDWGGFYAQSWLLTHYIMSSADRRAKLKLYLQAWRQDGDSVKAWKTAFGEDVATLTRNLRSYQQRPLKGIVIPRAARPQVAMTITSLSRGADEVLLESQMLKSTVPKGHQPELLAQVRGVHGKMPADRFARIAAARAETKFGDRAAGEAILRQMIADDAGDWEALLVLAESRIAEARLVPAKRAENRTEARKLLAAASKLRPDDFRVYALYGQTVNGLPGEPTENTLNVLVKAVQLAPQVDWLRVTAASALMKRGNADEVRLLLEPVANNPHGGLATRAQQMLAEIDKKEAALAEPPPNTEDEGG